MAQGPDFPVTANMDTGTLNGSPKFVWYERGFNTNEPLTGLPPAGVPFQSQFNSDHWYVWSDYTTTNALLITPRPGETKGTFTLTSPQAFSRLSFLASAAGGSLNLNIIVHHEDQSTQTNTFRVDDWYQGPNPVFVANGRFDISSYKFDPISDKAWRLYAYDITVTNSASLVTHIEVVRRSNQFSANAAIFAVSGSTGGDYSPISVTGFNQDIVIEAGYSGFTLPNLRGRVQSVAPLVFSPGSTLSASFLISNDGGSISSPTKLGIYVRLAGDPYDEAHRVGELALPAIESNGIENAFEFQFTLSESLPIGFHELSFWIDPEFTVQEVFENDNQGFKQIGIGPNLAANGPPPTLNTNNGQREITFTFNLFNTGSESVPTKAFVFFGQSSGWLSTNGVKVAEIELPALSPSESPRAHNVTFPVPANSPQGIHYVSVWVDAPDLVREFVESDNIVSRPVELPADEPPGPPFLSDIPDQMIDEDGGPLRIEYVISGFKMLSFSRSVTLSPLGNHPIGKIDFEGDGTNRALIVHLVPERSGSATVHFRVQDDESVLEKSFTIDVRPVNDPPVVASIADLVIAADMGPVSIPIMVQDVDTLLPDLNGAVIFGATDLFVVNGINLVKTNGQFVLALTPRAGRSGTAQFVISISDGQSNVERQFSLNILAAALQVRVTDSINRLFELTGTAAEGGNLLVSTNLVDWVPIQAVEPRKAFRYEGTLRTHEFFKIGASPM